MIQIETVKSLVSDPFSASKRTKKVESEDTLKNGDETVKALDYDDEVGPVEPNGNLDSSKENVKDEKPILAKKISKKNLKTVKSKEEDDSAETQSALKYDKEEFKNPSNGKDWNFKISSWNVNGVRAWLEVYFQNKI